MAKKVGTFSNAEIFNGSPEEVYHFLLFIIGEGRFGKQYKSHGYLDHSLKNDIQSRGSTHITITDWHYPVRVVFEFSGAIYTYKKQFSITSIDNQSGISGVDYDNKVFAKYWLLSWLAKIQAKMTSNKEPDYLLARLAREFNTKQETGLDLAFQQFVDQIS